MGRGGRKFGSNWQQSWLMIINHSLGTYWDKKGLNSDGQIRSGPIRRAAGKTFNKV